MQTKLLTCIKVYHGFALDGIEFLYEDSTSQLFGKRGGGPGGSEFRFGALLTPQPTAFIPELQLIIVLGIDTRRGEILTGFYLRAGLWIDGIEILTSLGRRSGVFGNPVGGSGYVRLLLFLTSDPGSSTWVFIY